MNPDDYALSAATLDDIFVQSVVPAIFGEVAPPPNPLLILIGAQPGAGKTKAGQDASVASEQQVIAIIGDDLRPFHPHYRRLMRSSPADMPMATAQALSGWVERSIDYAAEHRISVLVEGTFRNPDVTIATARKFKSNGFTVQAVLVAVPPEISHVSIARRFVTDARSGGQARFTPLGAHEVSFSALPATLAAISVAGSPVDRVTVCNRDDILFDEVRAGDSAIRGALETARAEWKRPLTDDEQWLWRELADNAVSYFKNNLSGDPEVQSLVDQLDIDKEYISISRGGGVAVRGHLRTAGAVRPHARPFPTRD